MLINEIGADTDAFAFCDECISAAEIEIAGYGEGPDLQLCGDCAMEMCRKLLVDLCELKKRT